MEIKLDDIEMLFTDNEPDKNMVDQIDQCGIKLVVANWCKAYSTFTWNIDRKL